MSHLYRPFLSVKQAKILKRFIAIYLCSDFVFFVWWVGSPRRESGLVGYLITSIVLLYVHFSFWYYLYFVSRMRKINPYLPMPKLRVALITTRVPSAEPFEITKRTLKAMLNQDYPSQYDVWLADEDPDRNVKRWCKKHGVRISTRKNKHDYHQPTWPRRTRSKEGNLAYFYDTYGYDLYDVVFQFDADHVPEAGYVKHAIKPYADKSVGYVAAPSICDSNARESWSARGRLYVEASMHGSYQMGLNGEFMPHCIGSHYSVRTKALKQIGGIGPELAEDFSTTYLMSINGWNGAFAPDAIAHGDGPVTFADCMKQEFQWSRSLMNLFLTVVPPGLKKLSFKKKFQVVNALLWYPMVVVVSVLGYVLPLVAILKNQPIVSINYVAFVGITSTQLIIVISLVRWLRNQGVFRPADTKVMSWESLLYLLARWPYVAWGIMHSLFDTFSKREFSFKITPKQKNQADELSIIKVSGYILFAILPAMVAVFKSDQTRASGYYFLGLVTSMSYAVLVAAIFYRHFREVSESIASTSGIAKLTLSASLIGISLLGVIAAQHQLNLLFRYIIGSL